MNYPKNHQFKIIQFLKIAFWNDSLKTLLECLWSRPGLMVVPAAPALGELHDDSDYKLALQSADYAIVDSIAVAILLALTRLRPVNRISGLRFLQAFFSESEKFRLAGKTVLWVLPNQNEIAPLRTFLKEKDVPVEKNEFYLAPYYQSAESFKDAPLFELISSSKPDCVVICIGGGKQEKLGMQIRDQFPGKFPILCIGAAISFMTGSQASIPTWADRMGLGWLLRSIDNPRVYGKRYFWALIKFPKVVVREYVASLSRAR